MLKYNNLFIILGVVLLLFSCSKMTQGENLEEKSDSDIVKTVSFVVPSFVDGDIGLTKTQLGSDGVSFYWSPNDTVGIYPSSGSQVYFVVEGGEPAKYATFDGGGWSFKLNAEYYSYYPFIGNMYLNREHIPVSYVGQKQIGTTSTSHIGPFDFMYTAATSSSSGSLQFEYSHLSALINVKATLPAGTYTKLAITAPSDAFTTTGYFSLLSSSPAIVATEHSNQIVIDLESITLSAQTMFNVYLLCAPVDLQGVEITVSALNSQRKEYQCKKTPSKAYLAGKRYGLSCDSFTEVPQSMGLIIDDWGDGGDIGGDAD
ncbi:MAG: fimbrillin family protein [Bacteroidales bacterium]|nr:fimbrillin family protein [Bacteroidales bacterium]